MTEMFKLGFNDKLREYNQVENKTTSDILKSVLGFTGTGLGIAGAAKFKDAKARIASGIAAFLSGVYGASKLSQGVTGLGTMSNISMDMSSEELDHILKRRRVLHGDPERRVRLRLRERDGSGFGYDIGKRA